VCKKIFGSYMGYADFDGKRYFDLREMDNYELEDLPTDSKDPIMLTSEARNRIDLVELMKGNVE
jgi:hypothetical protein